MKLSVAPVFPIWLIVVLVLLAIGLRIAAAIVSARRRGQLPGRQEWLRLGMALLAIVFLGLASLRIGDESRAERPPRLTTTAEESNINVFLVMDRSEGMTAYGFGNPHPRTAYDDIQQRIKGAIGDAEVVLTKYPDARFSVISYADTARVDWPISRDEWSLTPFLQNFSPYGDRYSDNGVLTANVAASNSLLKEQLNEASRTYPGSANLVFIFGAGSDAGDWAFDIPPAQISGGAVFGYGTQGYKPRVDTGSGDVEVPLNEDAMRTAADSLGLSYVKRESGLLNADDLPGAVPPAVPVDKIVPKVPHPDRIEYYWVFAAIAAVLFGVELYGLARHWLRRRRVAVRK